MTDHKAKPLRIGVVIVDDDQPPPEQRLTPEQMRERAERSRPRPFAPASWFTLGNAGPVVEDVSGEGIELKLQSDVPPTPRKQG